jgi:hypothetical protein
MTSRERWTIYPLLFLSLGMGLRSRLTGMESATTVRCRQLVIVDEAGKPLILAGASRDGSAGEILIQTVGGVPQVDIGSNGAAGNVRTFGPDGKPLTLLRGSPRGGHIALLRGDQQVVFSLGHDDEDSGLFALDVPSGQVSAVPFLPVVRKPAEAEPQPVPVP